MIGIGRETAAAAGGWALDVLMALTCAGAVLAGLGALVVLAAMATGAWPR